MVYLIAVALLVLIGLLVVKGRTKTNGGPPSKASINDAARQAPDMTRTDERESSEVNSKAGGREYQVVEDGQADEEDLPEDGSKFTETHIKAKGAHSGVYKHVKFLPPIKKGYQIFLQNMFVAGVGFRRDQCIGFIEDTNQSIRLEREADNPEDENAIRVVGIGEAREYFLGYLPRQAALQIVKTDLLEDVYGRLVKAYRGTDDYLEIQLQVVGRKEKKKQFDEFAQNLPATEEQVEYLNYWKVSSEESLTVGEAAKIIAEHIAKASQDVSAWAEYQRHFELLEELQDSDLQESYGVTDVPKSVLVSVLEQLKVELGTLEDVVDDLDLIFDRILAEHPELSSD